MTDADPGNTAAATCPCRRARPCPVLLLAGVGVAETARARELSAEACCMLARAFDAAAA